MHSPGANSILVKADFLDMAKRRYVPSAVVKLMGPKTNQPIKSQPMPPFIGRCRDHEGR
jgi:hypothetical protein